MKIAFPDEIGVFPMSILNLTGARFELSRFRLDLTG